MFGSKGGFKLFGQEKIDFDNFDTLSQSIVLNNPKPSHESDEEKELIEKVNEIELHREIAGKSKHSARATRKTRTRLEELPVDWSLKESMVCYSTSPLLRQDFRMCKDPLEGLLRYYEYSSVHVRNKSEQEELAKALAEWVQTISDVYYRYLYKKVPYFYVFTKVCTILFCRAPRPVAVMNTTMRSMKVIFEKYSIHSDIVSKDMSVKSLQSPDAVQAQSQAVDDFASQAFCEFSQRLSFMEKPNEGIYRFEGKNVQRLFAFVVNEWRAGEKDARIVAPENFVNAAYKLPAISVVSISKVADHTDSLVQTSVNGFVLADKLPKVIQYFTDSSKEPVEIKFTYNKNTILFNAIAGVMRYPLIRVTADSRTGSSIECEEDYSENSEGH